MKKLFLMLVAAILVLTMSFNGYAQDDTSGILMGTCFDDAGCASYNVEGIEFTCNIVDGVGNCEPGEPTIVYAAGSGGDNTTLYYIIAAIVIIVAGGYWYMKNKPATKGKKTKAKKK